ncbi:MAG: Hsp20/alpha crystallin family protein [Deltaproteobacteria bacterium]|nr:Hsp20/alpha crystallin family protein [Deltaproteobacteria bacterium]
MAGVKVREGDGGALARRESLDPFRTMQSMMQDVFEPFLARPWGGRLFPTSLEVGLSPAFVVKERTDAYVIEADVPGVKESDVDITLSGSRLSVSGKRDETRREEGETFYGYERQYGSFTRSFSLPEGVDPERISADLDSGVLSILVPKKESSKARKITLKERIKQLKS